MEVSALLGRSLSILIERSEAAVLSAMVSFLLYMLVIIWGFVDQKLFRLWIVLPGGTVFCYFVNTTIFV